MKKSNSAARRLLAVLLAFTMCAGLLGTTALADDRDTTYCGFEAHTHGEECCTEREALVCTEDHEHTEECYETVRTLSCALPEHTHTDECYVNPSAQASPAANTDGPEIADDTTPDTAGETPKDGVAAVGGTTYPTLQEALEAVPDKGTVVLTQSVTESVTVSGKSFTLNLNGNSVGSITVTVPAGGSVTVENGTVTGTDGMALSFTGSSGGDVTLNGLTVSGVTGAKQGAALSCEKLDNLTVTNCHFDNNTFGSAAVYVNGQFAYNGSAYAPTGKTSMTGCTFSGNSSDEGNSDTVFLWNTDVEINGCEFTGNTAVRTGGLYLNNVDAAISSTTFTGNTAEIAGGLYTSGSKKVTVTGCTFTENRATTTAATNKTDMAAGGIVSKAKIDLSNTRIANNTAVSGAGGLCVDQICYIFNESVITGNSVEDTGDYSSGGIKTTSITLNLKSISSPYTYAAVYNNDRYDIVSSTSTNVIAASTMQGDGKDFSEYVWKNYSIDAGNGDLPEYYKDAIDNSTAYMPQGSKLIDTLRIKAEPAQAKGKLVIQHVVQGAEGSNTNPLNKNFALSISGMDNQHIKGNTPLEIKVEPGTYTIKAYPQGTDEISGYTLTTTIDPEVVEIKSGETVTVTVTHTYSKLATLTIYNTMVGYTGDTKITFHYTVTDSSGKVYNGQSYGNSYTYVPLPAGQYTLIQEKTKVDGWKYTTTYDMTTFTVEDGAEIDVHITNTFKPAGNEARIGNTEYETLAEALENVASNQTVVLLEDVSLEKTVGILEDVTLNLGGNDLVGNITMYSGAGLTLENGKLEGTVTVSGAAKLKVNSSCGVDKIVVTDSVGQVTLAGDTAYNVTLCKDAFVTVEGTDAPHINITLDTAAYGEYVENVNAKRSVSWLLVKGAGSAENVTITNGVLYGRRPVVKVAGEGLELSAEKVVDPDVAVYLNGAKGDDRQDGLSYDSAVRTFERAKEVLENSTASKIYVTGVVNVIKTETWDLEGGMLVRYPGGSGHDPFTGNLVQVLKMGDLTLTDIVLDGSGTRFPLGLAGEVKEDVPVCGGALVKVLAGKLTIADGAVLQNNTKNGKQGDNAWDEAVVGGAVFATNQAQVFMTGGKITGNTATHGGGMGFYRSTFTMTGGTIVSNTASECPANHGKERPKDPEDWLDNDKWVKACGGGVFLAYKSEFHLKGGTIISNLSDYFGGGVAVGGDNSAIVKDKPTIYMEGGTVSLNNSKNCGGGIFVETGGKGVFTGGDILENTSTSGLFGGGGIYVNGGTLEGIENGLIELTNVAIYENDCPGDGAALAGCPTSHITVYQTNGAVIFDNKGLSDIFVSPVRTSNHVGDPVARISDFMLGGGVYRWRYRDGTPCEVNENGEVTMYYSYQTAVKTDAARSDLDVTEGFAQARLRIAYNHAQNRGGGIGSNGDVKIGVKENSGLWIEKRADGEGARNYTDEVFTFTVWFDTTEIPSNTVRMTVENETPEIVSLVNGTCTVQLKAGQGVFFSDIPVGTHFRVTEAASANTDRTGVVYVGDPNAYTVEELRSNGMVVKKWKQYSRKTGTFEAEGEILPDNFVSLAIYTNTFDAGSLVVTKTVTGEAGETDREFNFTVTLGDSSVNGEYGEMKFVNGVAAFTLKNGETKTATQLPKNVAYTVTEAEANRDNYTTSGTGWSGTITANKTATAEFINHRDTTVREERTSVSVRKVWDDEGYETQRPESIRVQLYRGGTALGVPVTLSDSNGWSYTWTDLYEGYVYSVAELDAPEGYTSAVTGSGTSFTIVNTYTPGPQLGSLTVVKTVSGGGEEAANKVYTFTVAGPEGYSATLTVTGSGSATLADLVPGEYTVTEQDAAIDGYALTVTGTGSVTVEANAAAVVEVVNTYVPESEAGSLTIVKTVEGLDGDDLDRAFTFTVTGPEGYSATVTVPANGSVMLSGLVPGTYTVTESEAGVEGYNLVDVIGQGSVEVAAGAMANIEITNVYEPDTEIPDEPPPLEDLPDVPPPLEDIPDEPDVPLDEQPKTGDKSRRGTWLALMASSFSGMIALLFLGKKKEE